MGKKACFFVKLKDKNHLSRVGFYKQDIDILKDLGYDVVIATRFRDIPLGVDLYYVYWWTWAFLPVMIARFLKKPVVITGVFDHYVDGKPLDFYHRPFVHRLLMRFSLRYSTSNIFISKLENDIIQKFFSISTSYLSPLSIDCNRYNLDMQLNRGVTTLFTISLLSKENVKRKKILECIQAVHLLKQDYPDVHLIIAGKIDNGIQEIRELIQELDISDSITITDAITEEQKITYLRTCSIYLQPTQVEGFGLAILEAMACGCPVISSPNGTVPEVMSDTGLYIESDDISIFRDKIKFLFENRNIATEYGIRAAERAKNYSYEKRLDRMRNIITNIVQ